MNQLASKLANSVRQAKTTSTEGEVESVSSEVEAPAASSPEAATPKASTPKTKPKVKAQAKPQARASKAKAVKKPAKSVEDDAPLPLLSFSRRVWPD